MTANFCGGCGSELAPDELFCTSCGRKSAKQPEAAQPARLETPDPPTADQMASAYELSLRPVPSKPKPLVKADQVSAIVPLDSRPTLPVVSSANASLWCNECESDDHVIRASGIVASSTSYGVIEGVVQGQSTTRTTGTISPRNRTSMYDSGSQINQTNTTASSFALNANSRETTALALRIDAVKPKPPFGADPVRPEPPSAWGYFWFGLLMAPVSFGCFLLLDFFKGNGVTMSPLLIIVAIISGFLMSWIFYYEELKKVKQKQDIYSKESETIRLVKREYYNQLALYDWDSLCYCNKHDRLYIRQQRGTWVTV